MCIYYKWPRPGSQYSEAFMRQDNVRCVFTGEPIEPPFMVWRAAADVFINAKSLREWIVNGDTESFLHDLIELLHCAKLRSGIGGREYIAHRANNHLNY